MIVALPVSREKILTTARLLPAAPQVLAGLCELLQDANSDLDQVAEQIRVDSALSARVIRIRSASGRSCASSASRRSLVWWTVL